jgi:hypothetical protein
MEFASPWAFAIIGGPLLLLIALVIARTITGRYDRKIDPSRPSDDPAQGMKAPRRR